MSEKPMLGIGEECSVSISESWHAARYEVAHQACDEGLWFVPETAAEAYLQLKLRKLHAIIETDRP